MSDEKATEGVQGLEQALKDLEQIVINLEKGDLPLAEAIRQFERGVELTRRCQQVLKEAEQKVQVLSDGMLEDVDPKTLRKPDGENGGGGSLPL
ncbi:MAG: exodeoxyribonuclease VII small subunit [Gammaproteobacteria bacterium]|nr:exodeoxyribonuclease VII small subunit [Gammaproteobacteria bacterium]MXW19887.1 exodeoxyribonuclease VII small subunit [Gammaproteobacteria bacterium]MXZ28887.1 exodeoxyribonuclease VII small subunit [Gammaproteobacteria bacterium]MYF58429.1 exodeoxyribonuclease VII small subunit [Gammaproteobacteria bacterium]MYH32738.1 exodeoxyribonuclease VII small subunit [Gammaproteobacteria bacterium]